MSPSQLSTRAILVRSTLRKVMPTIRKANNIDRLRWTFSLATRLRPGSNKARIEHQNIAGVPVEIIVPDRLTSASSLVYLHGGGYCTGSSREYRMWATQLAAAAGMKIYLPNYRLAPENPFPMGLNDTCAVWESLTSNQEEFLLGGDSAGGGLALALMHKINANGWRPPKKLYLLSPWLDLTLTSESRERLDKADPFLKTRWLESQFAQPYAGEHDRKNISISPLFGDADNMPPTLIQVGELEILRDDSLKWAEKIRACGGDVWVTTGKGLWHTWPLFSPLFPEARQATRQVASWLAQQ